MPSRRLSVRLSALLLLSLLLTACAPLPPAATLPSTQAVEDAPLPPLNGLPAPKTSASPDETAEGEVEAQMEETGAPESAVEDATDGTGEGNPPFEVVNSGQSASAPEAGSGAAQRYYAVVASFDTLQDEMTLDELAARWQGAGAVYTSDDALALLPSILGDPGAMTTAVAPDALIGLLEADRTAIGLIPFEQIDPRFKVLTVDGVNLLSNQLQPDTYALAIPVAADAQPGPNRDPAKLTTLVMTGVTAMARGTADATERSGDYAYPALVIGPELALADITHVSNEIPFIEGCEVRNFENNLILCSKPEYWAALELMGTDIVGLSGNHVNDFGRDGARESLGWYKGNNIPIYGSGLTVDEACAPLLWEHNGNTFAFIAALAYGPESAWVTDEEPGACAYYEHKERILSTIRTLSQALDIVAVELQYEETYFASPTPAQVEEFRELRAAGADLVTGVQSHVPQAQEPYGQFDDGGRGFISYGLGNLYFDQMWSWETRAELYARHAIYDGQIINSEILTGMLEDFAQPRWATPDERIDILTYIFDGAPTRP